MDGKLAATIARINKRVPGAVVWGSEITQDTLPRITTGSLGLDVALGGGWVTNHWNEIVGLPSAGKTMLVLKTIAANQALDPNWTVVWCAAEDFVDSYAVMLGCDLSRFIVVNENGMEPVYQAAIDFIKSRSVDCLVIDSLPALVPVREDEKTMEDFQPGLSAFLTGKFFRKVAPSLKGSLVEGGRPISGFIINEWRQKFVTMGDPRTTPGGQSKDFRCFIRVEIRRDEWIKNTRDVPIGQVLRISTIKNKTAPSGRLAYIDAYFADGNDHKAGDFDTLKDLVEAAKAYGVIERSGAYYTFGTKKWHGNAEMLAALRKSSVTRRKITDAVMEATTVRPVSPAPVQLGLVKATS